MIVKCDQCQTRFKIPDEKVTPKGIKVRCTKCSNTFRVYRAPDAAAPAPEAAPAPKLPEQDPFAQFAPAPDPPPGQSTRPGYFAEGVEASKAPGDLSSIFSEPTRVAPAPTPPKAADDLSDIFGPPVAAPPPSKAAPALDVDFGLSLAEAPPAVTQPEQPLLRGPPDESEATAQATREDLFAAQGVAAPSSPPPESPPAPEYGMFDIPPAPPEESPPAADHGLFDIPPAPPEASPLQEGPPPFAGPVQKPAGRPEDARGLEAVPQAKGAARRVSGVFVNLSVSAVLLVVLVGVGGVYLNEGKVDLSLVSLEHVRELVFPPRQVAAVDVSNGLYETREGRPVFYVRGEIANRSASPAKVKVRAEILDGSQLVRAAEGWAGAVPTAEELYAVRSPEDADALIARLAAGARAVAPGGRVPFLLAFYEYPPDLSAYRLRVTVIDASSETASR